MGKRQVVSKWMRPWRIVKGDTVYVRTGGEKNKTGLVTRVDRNKERVWVDGLNLKKKHIRRTEENPGGIFLVPGSIHYSNVALIDPETGKPCRSSYRFQEDGSKVRIALGRRASGAIIPYPPFERKKPRDVTVGPKCTPESEVNKTTYSGVTTNFRGFFTSIRGFAASAFRYL
jgi:large subunit ribosomal protein L24